MNAGRDYAKAKAQAQANANLDGKPRTLHSYRGEWWINRLDSYGHCPEDAEIVMQDGAPAVPEGLEPRIGVEIGCGCIDCPDCYQTRGTLREEGAKPCR